MQTHPDASNPQQSSGISERWGSWAPQLLSIVRIVAAFAFLQSGTMKLFAFPIGVPPNNGTVPLLSEAGIGGVLEVAGGMLLLVGLFARPVAFVLAGEMAVAYFQFHHPNGIWPVVNGGIPAMLFCFLWLYISAAGAGPWSLDAVRSRRAAARRRAAGAGRHAAGAGRHAGSVHGGPTSPGVGDSSGATHLAST